MTSNIKFKRSASTNTLTTLPFGSPAVTSPAAGQINLYIGDQTNAPVLVSSVGSGAGNITGSGTANQLAYFSDSDTVSGSSVISQNGNQIILGAGDGSNPLNLTIRGAAAAGSGLTGSDITFQAQNGTGGGGSGKFIFQTAPAQNTVPQIISQSSQSNINSNSFSFTHTVPLSGTSRALFVLVAYSFYTPSSPVSSATCGGAAMTLLFTNGNQPPSQRIEAWYILNPSSGSNTIAFTFTTFITVATFAFTVSGVNQTTPLRAGIGQTNSSGFSPATVSLSGTVANDLVIDFICIQTATLTVGSGQSSLWNTTISSSGLTLRASSKQATSTSTSMQYTWTGGAQRSFSYNAFAIVSIPSTSPSTMRNNIGISNLNNTLPVLNIYGGIAVNSCVTVTSSSTIAAHVTLVNSSGATTQTLPSAVFYPYALFRIKNIGSGTVTIISAAGNVEGASTSTLANLALVSFISDGTNWWKI